MCLVSVLALPIKKQDGGSDERFTDTTLVVNLVDVQDPPPAFSLSAYTVDVSEGMYTDVSQHAETPGKWIYVHILLGFRSQASSMQLHDVAHYLHCFVISNQLNWFCPRGVQFSQLHVLVWLPNPVYLLA